MLSHWLTDYRFLRRCSLSQTQEIHALQRLLIKEASRRNCLVLLPLNDGGLHPAPSPRRSHLDKSRLPEALVERA